MPKRFPYVGDGAQGESVPIGSLVFGLTNPNAARFLSPDGSIKPLAAWPKLSGLFPQSRFVGLKSTPLSISGSLTQIKKTGPGANELLMWDGGGTQIAQSLDGGVTWTAKTGVPSSRYSSDSGAPNLWNGGNADILWDPVSARYILIYGFYGGPGNATDQNYCMLYSTADLATWAYHGLLYSNNWNAITGPGRHMLERNTAGDCIMCNGWHIYRKAAGQALNTVAGWTATLNNPGGTNGHQMQARKINNQFVAQWSDPTFKVSADGITWSANKTLTGTSSYRNPIGHTGGLYIFANSYWGGMGAGNLAYTTDISGASVALTALTVGIAQGFPQNNQSFLSYHWNAALGLHVVTYQSTGSTYFVAYSSDLVTWSGHFQLPTADKIYQMIYEPTRDLIVGLPSDATANKLVDPAIYLKLPTHAITQVRAGQTLNPYLKAA